MAAARDRRCKQQGRCAAADAPSGASLVRSLALVRCANPRHCKAHPRLPAVRRSLPPRPLCRGACSTPSAAMSWCITRPLGTGAPTTAWTTPARRALRWRHPWRARWGVCRGRGQLGHRGGVGGCRWPQLAAVRRGRSCRKSRGYRSRRAEAWHGGHCWLRVRRGEPHPCGGKKQGESYLDPAKLPE